MNDNIKTMPAVAFALWFSKKIRNRREEAQVYKLFGENFPGIDAHRSFSEILRLNGLAKAVNSIYAESSYHGFLETLEDIQASPEFHTTAHREGVIYNSEF